MVVIFRKPEQPTPIKAWEEQVAEASEPQPHLDITLKRDAWLVQERDKAKFCPRCHAGLQSSNQTYVVRTRRGPKDQDSFLIRSDALGFYCLHCPTVVLVLSEVRNKLALSLPHWQVGSEFTILGIVDWDAMPEDRSLADVGLEETLNIALVPFASLSQGSSTLQKPKSRPRNKKKKRPRPRSRH